MRVLQIGNVKPPHSTENHLKRALEYDGHEVVAVQEDDPKGFGFIVHDLDAREFDFALWTRTGWDWDRNGYPGGRVQANADQHAFLRKFHFYNVPVIGYHLDIWFGLKRQTEVDVEPFFHVPLLITADGGHGGEWIVHEVNHLWFPPAVSLAECGMGTPRDEFKSPIAFVGSWQGGYHQEHPHRQQLVEWLQNNFRRDCAFWPKPGQHAVRGEPLRDLYASVDVVVGDSCFVGTGLKNYWSDRVPETLGRGGFLLHPFVPGLESEFPAPHGPQMWEAGDWDHLGKSIENSLALSPAARQGINRANIEWVKKFHTYEARMAQVVDLVANGGVDA